MKFKMEMLSQKQKILAIIVIIIVACIVVYYYINSTREIYSYSEIDDIVEPEEIEEEINEEEEEKIIVHITGAVKNNGIVEVKINARINDVIEAAGGITEEANLDKVNLAYMVQDGQKIYIPTKNEQEEEEVEEVEEETNIITESAGEKILEEQTENSVETNININTATQEKLEELPGIGSSTALKIINYRETNGKFKTIEDIKNVPGIGDAKFQTIKDYIRI